MNNTLLVLQALGYQGGTIHQAAKETGLTIDQILTLHNFNGEEYLGTSFSSGWSAVRTCSLEFNRKVNYPDNFGNADFWAGVVRGLYLKQQEQGI